MNSPEKLSKGCQLCQQGKWLCIFITYQCNASCHFCQTPFKDDRIHSAFGDRKEDILPFLINNNFGGISFSGGDPFIVFDRLMEWLIYFKKHLPGYYYWVYTSGLDVDRQKMEQLALAGMDEIRFNIAATGYVSESIRDCIQTARNLFPYVTVEIPSIQQDYPLLETALENLEKIGVDYLNMHDYILSESDINYRKEQSETFILNKTIPLKYALTSIKNTQKTIRHAIEKKYHFHINHCSMQQKELQMKWRRINMGRIFNNKEYDLVQEDGTICNYYRIPDEMYTTDMRKKLEDPDFLKTLNLNLIKTKDLSDLESSGFRIIKTTYIPQMEINQKKILIGINVINANLTD